MNKRKGSTNNSQFISSEDSSPKMCLLLSKAKTFSPIKEYGKTHPKKFRKYESKYTDQQPIFKMMPRLAQTLSMVQKPPQKPPNLELNKENDSSHYQFSHKNRLQQRVQMLVAERKKILSTIDGGDIITERTTIQIPNVRSCQSMESDVDKQVNFLYTESSDEEYGNGGFDFLQEEESMVQMVGWKRKFQGLRVEVTPGRSMLVDAGNTGLGILIRYLSANSQALQHIFKECSCSKESFKVNIYIKGRKKVLILDLLVPEETIISKAILQKGVVYLYPLLLEKVLAKICGSYYKIHQMDIADIFRVFVPIPIKTILSNHPDLKNILNNPQNKAFVVDSDNTYYHQLVHATESGVDIVSEQMSKTVIYEYLRFLHDQVHYFKSQGRYYQDNIKIKHHPNHFSVLSFRIAQPGQFTLRVYHNSQALAAVVNCKTQNILKGHPNTNQTIELDCFLHPGDHQIMVLTQSGQATVQILSKSQTKLSIKHKIQYRLYCSQLIRQYLNSKTLDLNKYKKPTLLRAQLFIGLSAQILLNPTQQPLELELTWTEQVLCDVYYKRFHFRITVPAASIEIIPVRKLTNVCCVPELDRVMIRI